LLHAYDEAGDTYLIEIFIYSHKNLRSWWRKSFVCLQIYIMNLWCKNLC